MIFLPNVSLQNFRTSIEVFVTIFVVCWFGWTKYSYHFEFFFCFSCVLVVWVRAVLNGLLLVTRNDLYQAERKTLVMTSTQGVETMVTSTGKDPFRTFLTCSFWVQIIYCKNTSRCYATQCFREN